MNSARLKLLIIGGYGTFGGRIVRLLAAESRLTIIIAGRSLHKARNFVSAQTGPATMIPGRFDRDGDVQAQLDDHNPDIVIDASGPFQSYGSKPYRVVDASIAKGINYIDLADSSSFVQDVSKYDAAAKQQGVFVLSGASTCPVLTAAVTTHLSKGLTKVDSITGGIAPSPFAGLGLSVVQGIAGYAGKPLLVRRNNELQESHALTETRHHTIAPPGHLPLRPMTFSLLDVPDLQLLATLDPPARNVWFGVATTPAIYHAVLRLLARLVKAGVIPSINPLARTMHYFMNKLSWGEHRGGMFMEVRGTDAEQRDIVRTWHLVAEADDGPMIPVLAAVNIVRRCLESSPPEPGARSAMGALDLSEYEAMFGQFTIDTGVRENTVPADWPLFRQILASAWTELPAEIQELHDVDSHKRFSGEATVTRGRSLLAGMVARIVGFPAASNSVSVTVDIQRSADRETWKRNFDGHSFASEMSLGKGYFSRLVCERFGPCKFGMALVIDKNRLRYVPRRWTFLGIPMPIFLAPSGKMVETADRGKFNFHVEIGLPVVGHIVTYKGWLENNDQEAVNS